jgi:hypothetical protein
LRGHYKISDLDGFLAAAALKSLSRWPPWHSSPREPRGDEWCGQERCHISDLSMGYTKVRRRTGLLRGKGLFRLRPHPARRPSSLGVRVRRRRDPSLLRDCGVKPPSGKTDRKHRYPAIQLVAPVINSNPRSTVAEGHAASKRFAPTLPISVRGVRMVDKGNGVRPAISNPL